MIRINQLKMPVGHDQKALRQKAANTLHLRPEELTEIKIIKQSVDARQKPDLFYHYTLDIAVAKERKVIKKQRRNTAVLVKPEQYQPPPPGQYKLGGPPVVVGSGPAGLFCACLLARSGYRPILLERGEDADTRSEKVAEFWRTGVLNPNSNVQFGEGGAGTFSDGKLNTLVKDKAMRNQKVLELLVEFGANEQILYKSKPHLGTDVLCELVKRIRTEIISLGGQVHFSSQVTDLVVENGRVSGVEINHETILAAEAVILAVGHSARDTFEMLNQKKIVMEAKPFAVGLRIQHPQAVINQSQYGRSQVKELGAASYKLTRQTSNGRGVYSFCMCPGGYVVDASSETERLAVNGMSYHDRAGENANSALIVTITPGDFIGKSPLSGVEYQRHLETLAYRAGNSSIPVQLFGDFKKNQPSKTLGEVAAAFKGRWSFGDLRGLLPEPLACSLIEGMTYFGRVIEGFDRSDALLSGVESRTSSPLRISRNENFESLGVSGLYPCGEGAGYAGGITSAAMDGIKIAEAVIRKYAPLQ